MSSFQDIETQNARRSWAGSPMAATVGYRGAMSRASLHRDGAREWMTQTEIERFVALTRHVRDAYNRHRLVTREGTAPLRTPRTALGFGLLPPVAP